MATWVLSECGLKPFGPVFSKPRTGFAVSNNSKVRFLGTSKGVSDLKLQFQQKSFDFKEKRKWGLNVSTPLRVESIEQQQEELPEFDPSSPPPFSLADIRAAIPKHCWVKDSWRSMSYVLRDVVVVFGLAAAAAYLNNWMVWPLYWAAQGTMFWALFVLGHDCGHGSFSNDANLNSVVGHFLHSSILVPYHGWRISHRTHHQNHGHVENDESWLPLTETLYKGLDTITRSLRFTAPFPLLAYPVYLWTRSPGKKGSHFHPGSDLFVPNEKKDVITSTASWLAMGALLVGLGFAIGPIPLLMLYGVPYVIFVMWLDFVTYMHHHGHEDKLPWYRGKEWSYLRGGLTTLDRDYGWINNIHHDIGTHVVHHLFPQIPHYHLVEAARRNQPHNQSTIISEIIAQTLSQNKTNNQSTLQRRRFFHLPVSSLYILIKRSVNLDKGEEAAENNKPVIYEDVSLERGSFLVQQAMRAFRAQNLEKCQIKTQPMCRRRL